MMDFARQNDFATMGASFARMYANAAMRTLVATASHGLLLWSGFLAASVPKAPFADWHSSTAVVEQAMRLTPYAWMTASAPTLTAATTIPWFAPEPVDVSAPAEPGEQAFASYRSAGGHATAQIIMAPLPKA